MQDTFILPGCGYIQPEHGAVTTLEWGKSADGVIVVEAVTLDHFAADHRSPTLVKIDVEGRGRGIERGGGGDSQIKADVDL